MEQTKIGVGFITGRKSFQNVLRTYVDNWEQSGFDNLHLFVAYDLQYNNTKASDYFVSDEKTMNMMEQIHYIGTKDVLDEINFLVARGILTKKEATLLFSGKYSGKRNIILCSAIKNGLDSLLFLDDDEYPMAVMGDEKGNAWWNGQQVLATHLAHLPDCDITHGHHCGYISPIPSFEFNQKLSEREFRIFIEAISNDIISWDSIKEKMKNGGVGYADSDLLLTDQSYSVEQEAGLKFISGSNLGINLQEPRRIFPFYNPPEARGEDTFLATCLEHRRVEKVPCYTFHDGFSVYQQLLNGALPERLRPIRPDSKMIRQRFLKAAIGWVRYKPLLLYITKPDSYQQELKKMREDLSFTVPKLVAYFENEEFNLILDEMDKYSSLVENHFREFMQTRQAWAKMMNYFDMFGEVTQPFALKNYV